MLTVLIESLYCGPIVDQKRNREFSATRGTTALWPGASSVARAATVNTTHESRDDTSNGADATQRAQYTQGPGRNICPSSAARRAVQSTGDAGRSWSIEPSECRPGPCVQWTWRSPRAVPNPGSSEGLVGQLLPGAPYQTAVAGLPHRSGEARRLSRWVECRSSCLLRASRDG